MLRFSENDQGGFLGNCPSFDRFMSVTGDIFQGDGTSLVERVF